MVRLASLISMSTSSLEASSLIIILLEPAFIFLNSRSAPVFLANIPTPPLPTFEAVFVCPDVAAKASTSALSSSIAAWASVELSPEVVLS